jgi:hypothetical protein
LGPGAKEALLEALYGLESKRESGPAQNVIKDALRSMLTADDQDVLLKDLNSPNPQLLDILQKLHLEEAKPAVLQKLQDAVGNLRQGLDYRIAVLGLELDEEKALPMVLNLIGAGRNGAYLAEKVDKMFPDVDMTAQLRSAAGKADTYENPRFAELMLKRGMPEGLAFAAECLLDTEKSSGFYGDTGDIRNAVRRYVNVTGSDAEVAQWILDNRAKLVWNPDTKMFEEK